MSRGSKPAVVRFYFDADVLGVAKVLAALRSDITYPSDPGDVIHKRRRPACPIADAATPDTEWLPEVAQRGWLIVTRDSRIQEHHAEIEAVRVNGARMIALAGKEAIGIWAQLEVLMRQWRAIEGHLDDPGPFIFTATRSRLRRVPLD